MSMSKTRNRNRDKRKKRARREQRLARLLGPEAPRRGKGIPVLLCGQSLSDVSRGTGLDQSYLSRLTSDKASPSLATMERLRTYFHLPTIDAVLALLVSGGRVHDPVAATQMAELIVSLEHHK